MSTHTSNRNRPPLVYVLERGVQPWDDYIHPTADTLASLIVFARGCPPLISLSRELFDAIVISFPTSIRWYTTHRPLKALAVNRLQRRLFADNMSAPPPGFADAFLDVDGPDSIPCVASRLVLPITQMHLDALCYYNYVLLVLSPDVDLMPRNVCEALRPYDNGLDRGALESILSREPDWLLARVYNEEPDQCAWQFYGSEGAIEEIAGTLEALGVEELRDRGELATFLQTRA